MRRERLFLWVTSMRSCSEAPAFRLRGAMSEARLRSAAESYQGLHARWTVQCLPACAGRALCQPHLMLLNIPAALYMDCMIL